MDSAVFVVLSFADHKDSPVMHGELSCSFQLLPGTGKVVCSFLEVVEVSSKVIQESCDDLLEVLKVCLKVDRHPLRW